MGVTDYDDWLIGTGSLTVAHCFSIDRTWVCVVVGIVGSS